MDVLNKHKSLNIKNSQKKISLCKIKQENYFYSVYPYI